MTRRIGRPARSSSLFTQGEAKSDNVAGVAFNDSGRDARGSSAARTRQSERGHLLTIANQQNVA